LGTLPNGFGDPPQRLWGTFPTALGDLPNGFGGPSSQATESKTTSNGGLLYYHRKTQKQLSQHTFPANNPK